MKATEESIYSDFPVSIFTPTETAHGRAGVCVCLCQHSEGRPTVPAVKHVKK